MKLHRLTFLTFLFFLLVFILPHALLAQDKETKLDIQQRIENAAENAENEETDYTILLDELQYYQEHPINLNYTDRDELSKLELLSDIQINYLLKHIDKNGKLMTIYELQTIEGFDLNLIFRILPYVKVENNFDNPHVSFSEIFKYGKFQLVSRYQQVLEQQLGYYAANHLSDSVKKEHPNYYYLGPQFKLYERFNFTYANKINFGVVAEKDPGEEFFKGSQKNGFDFYSAHLFLKKFGKLKALALGDFQAQFGQGITFWSGLAFGKTADPTVIKKSARGLSAYNSVDENLFLRGGGATVAIKNFEFTAFGSTKKIDANVSVLDTLSNNAEEFSAFQTSGLHRTKTELADKDAVTENIFGGNVSYVTRSFSAGITGVKTEYKASLKRNLGVYNKFEFNQNHNLNIGADYNYLWRNFNIFGEISRSENGGIAYMNGALINLDQRFSISVLHRHYGKDYQPSKSKAFGESYTNFNEQGLFIGASAKILPKFTLAGYFDRFTFPWLKYQVYAPSHGYDYLAQLNYTPSKTIDMYVRVRTKLKQKNTPETVDYIDYLVNTEKTNYRFNISYSLSPEWKFANRVELIKYKESSSPSSTGYLIYQDIKFKPRGYKLSVIARYMLFQTQSFDSRVYTYENDVLYSNSIPFFSGKGSRIFALVNYDISRNVEVWVRYSQTYFTNPNVFIITDSGSLDTVIGNKKSEIKVQVRISF
ncbi:MAG: hypothetical protein IPP32_08065 [Bacteroidetes bacterium]|nr:hypothetical protein [Bacteroidota bacterium]